MTSQVIGVVGAGNMGRGLAQRLSTAGHEVLLADQHAERAESVAAEAASSNADAPVGKIVIDISNPLDENFTRVDLPGDTSGAEKLAAPLPRATIRPRIRRRIQISSHDRPQPGAPRRRHSLLMTGNGRPIALNWIDGEWVDTDNHRDSVDPATGTVIGRYAMAGAPEAERAIASPCPNGERAAV